MDDSQMHRISLRGGALALAFILSTTAGAAERHAGALGMRAAAQPAEPPVSSELPFGPELPPAPGDDTRPQPPPPTTAPPVDPVPAEAPSAVPPPVVDPAEERALDDTILRAEWTRDAAGSVMAGGGAVTVAGVILILAGFGASVVAVKKADCASDSSCLNEERKVIHAGRVTLAGLVISSLGALTLLGGMIGYGVARNRLARARMARGSFGGVALSPSHRGVAIGLRGRF